MKEDIEAYYKFELSKGRSSESMAQRKAMIVRFCEFIESRYGINNPDAITQEAVKLYGIFLSQGKTAKGLPYKAGYQNQQRLAIRSFLKYLHKSRLKESLPLVKEPSFLPTSVLSHEEALKLLNGIATDSSLGFRDRTMLELLYSSGIRVSELTGLDTGDINLKEKTAKVFGKGQKERMVVFGESACTYLENYLKAIRPFLNTQNKQAVFLSFRGKRLCPHNVRSIVGKWAEKAELKNVTPHTFRRSCTTELVRANANLYHIKELLGHESLDTLKSYTKLNVRDLKNMLEKFHPRK